MESIILTEQASLVANALELQNSSCSIPHLEKYFPFTKADVEIQQFNLYNKLPARLTTEDDIAMWILESEHLNRTKVYEYLGTIPEPVRVGSNGMRTRRDDAAKVVLKKIATKICSLDVAKGFVEGMKFFVPVVGCWDSSAFTEENFKANAVPELNRILTEYVLAHMKYSDKPIFPPSIVTENHVGTIVEIAMCVLSLSKVLHEGGKSNSAAMADFFATLRGVLRDQPANPATSGSAAATDSTLYGQYLLDQQKQSLSTAQPQPAPLSLSMKAMTDLFVATNTGLPLTALSQTHSAHRSGSYDTHHHNHHSLQGGGATAHAPVAHPSYLFVEHGLRGVVAVGFNVEDPLVHYYARLGSDALYLFHHKNSNNEITNNHDLPTKKVNHASVFNFGAEKTATPDRGQLVACIPLDAVHFRTHDSIQQPNLISITGLSGKAIPFVIFGSSSNSQGAAAPTAATTAAQAIDITTISGTENGGEALVYAGPTAVTFHRTILIDLSRQAVQRANAYDNWVDALESASWECRAAKSKPKLVL